MKKHIILIFIIFLMNILHAENLFVQNFDLKVNISFEKEKYRIGEDIFLNVEVINNQDDAVKFYTSPYKLNNIKIQILNLKQGEVVEEKYSKILEINNLKQDKPELFIFNNRTLYPDEVLKYKINLPDYFDFLEDGRYKIQIQFDPFPNVKTEHKIFLSNYVYLLLDKSIVDQGYQNIIMELKQKEEKKFYLPQETIEFMLKAYMHKDWDDYFLYQDLNKVIMQYEQFSKRYVQASDIMKQQIIEEYKNWVMTQKNKEIEDYQLLDVFQSYEKDKSIVKCKVRYKKPAFNRTFYYQYTLYRDGNKWKVDEIEVLNYSKEK